MNLKKIILSLFSFFALCACADFKMEKTNKNGEFFSYSSLGFALIYEQNLYNQKIVNKKINNENLVVMHDLLRINTPVKIINPKNSKFIDVKINKKASYPKIFNVVVSKKIASILDLDIENPYVEIIEIKKNKTFIAKKSKIFEEERIVAEKAPVDEIKMDNIGKEQTKPKEKLNKKNNFVLVISDFYYLDSANNLRKELVKKTNVDNIHVKRINNNKYRLFAGPFKNFNALKTTYISLNNLGFEDLNVHIIK